MSQQDGVRETIEKPAGKFSRRVWDYNTSWVRSRYAFDIPIPFSRSMTVTRESSQLCSELERSLVLVIGDEYVRHEVTSSASPYVGRDLKNSDAFPVSFNCNCTNCDVLSDGCINRHLSGHQKT